jgi:hypothetical protein
MRATGDRVWVVRPGPQLYWLGRADHVFKRDGKRFSAEDVAAILTQPNVAPWALECWYIHAHTDTKESRKNTYTYARARTHTHTYIHGHTHTCTRTYSDTEICPYARSHKGRGQILNVGGSVVWLPEAAVVVALVRLAGPVPDTNAIAATRARLHAHVSAEAHPDWALAVAPWPLGPTGKVRLLIDPCLCLGVCMCLSLSLFVSLCVSLSLFLSLRLMRMAAGGRWTARHCMHWRVT